jgi:tetratricopeptide (TPR) repeat protein
VAALVLTADALQDLRRYREALVVQDEALEAAEGTAVKREGDKDMTEERLSLYMNKMWILRHLGRLGEALDVSIKAVPLLRSDPSAETAYLFMEEAAMLYEAGGRLDLALELDAARVAHDERSSYDPDVVRRGAVYLAGQGRRGDAIDDLRDYVGMLEQEAQTPGDRLFTAEGKSDVRSDFLYANLQVLQLLKNLLRASGAEEDGSLPRHVADEIRQVRPLATRRCVYPGSHTGPD